MNNKCEHIDNTNCLKANSGYGCSKCKDGFFLNTTLECQKCDEECKTCVKSADNCLTTNDRYYFAKNGTVQKVDDNCEISDQSGCKKCKNDLEQRGYYVLDGVCTLCAENCTLCQNSAENCTSCIANHTLYWQSEAQTYSCYEKPVECIGAEMGYCTKCEVGHFIGNDMQCTKCHESCGTCEEKNSCLTCAENYYKGNTEGFCSPYSEIEMTCYPTKTGCNGDCKPGYYAESIAQINCTACPAQLNCKTCTYDQEKKNATCTQCQNDDKKPEETMFIRDGACVSCSEIAGCLKCSDEGCLECEGNLEPNGAECKDRHLDVIIPVVVVSAVVIILIIVIIIGVISWKKIHKKNAAKSIKPFKITSDLELSLLSADNKNFPLKTATWELNFGLDKNKALIDREYTQTVQIANTTKRGYFFEILATPSHRYELTIDPPRYTLQPGNAIELEFKIKMLCTASVSDEIGVIAMDIEDQNKETAKMTLIIESDLSLKLDHTDLQPQMPAIGRCIWYGLQRMLQRQRYCY